MKTETLNFRFIFYKMSITLGEKSKSFEKKCYNTVLPIASSDFEY